MQTGATGTELTFDYKRQGQRFLTNAVDEFLLHTFGHPSYMLVCGELKTTSVHGAGDCVYFGAEYGVVVPDVNGFLSLKQDDQVYEWLALSVVPLTMASVTYENFAPCAEFNPGLATGNMKMWCSGAMLEIYVLEWHSMIVMSAEPARLASALDHFISNGFVVKKA